MNTKVMQIAKKNEEKVLKAIKTLPKQEEYFVATYTELAKVTNMNNRTTADVVKRLERKGLIEVRKSFALFGSMHKRGFKIKNTLYLSEKGA